MSCLNSYNKKGFDLHELKLTKIIRPTATVFKYNYYPEYPGVGWVVFKFCRNNSFLHKNYISKIESKNFCMFLAIKSLIFNKKLMKIQSGFFSCERNTRLGSKDSPLVV